MVHCRVAGCAPPDVVKETPKLTVPPGTALPEPSETVACCATAGLAAVPNRIHGIRLRILFQELRCDECDEDLYIRIGSISKDRPAAIPFHLGLSLSEY